MGSIPTGRVLEIDTKTGTSQEAVPAREGHAAIGLKYDRGGNRLFVSGGPTGKAFVYDANGGAELAAFQLTAPGSRRSSTTSSSRAKPRTSRTPGSR